MDQLKTFMVFFCFIPNCVDQKQFYGNKKSETCVLKYILSYVEHDFEKWSSSKIAPSYTQRIWTRLWTNNSVITNNNAVIYILVKNVIKLKWFKIYYCNKYF